MWILFLHLATLFAFCNFASRLQREGKNKDGKRISEKLMETYQI
jgi:hypothetical protein